MKKPKTVCKGDWPKGTECGDCQKCRDTAKEYIRDLRWLLASAHQMFKNYNETLCEQWVHKQIKATIPLDAVMKEILDD